MTMKIVLIFINIFPCKPPLNLFSFVLSCYYLTFLNNFFLLALHWIGYVLKIVVFYNNLTQIEEKTHVPVTVHFPDSAFNENIHMHCFHEWDIFLIYLFL